MLRTMALIASVLAVIGWATPVTAASAAKTQPRQATSAPAQTVHTIVMDKMVFGAVPTDVRAGDVIEWVNHDIFEHTATARDGNFDVDLKPGAIARTTVKKAGSFAFYCKFHPGMVGTLLVK